jgi:hypothetical protein
MIQPPKKREISRLIIAQIPTADPTVSAFERGAPELAIVVNPIAAPIPLSTS